MLPTMVGYGQTMPSNEPEARAVLDAHIAKLRKRGWDELRAIAGEVRGKYLWGLLTVYDGPGSELSDAVAPSGAKYDIVTGVSWAGDEVGGALAVEVKIQEAADRGGWLITEFELAPDGSVEDVY